jgi:hypothetical protein
VRSVRWAWLLPILAGAVALGVVHMRPEPAHVRRTAVTETVTFVADDASRNGHDGIIQGPVQMGRPGHDGTAFSFAERGSWLMVPSSPQLDVGLNDFLVSVWIQVNSSPDPGETYDIVRKGIAYTVPGEYKLELLDGGRVRCSAKDAHSRVARVISEVSLADDGQWHRIGCARTGAEWSVLVDDTVESATVNLGAVTNDVALSIGSKYGLEDRPLGLIDDVKLIIDHDASPAADPDATPTADPVAAIRLLEELPPVAWWKLDEVATTAAGR